MQLYHLWKFLGPRLRLNNFKTYKEHDNALCEMIYLIRNLKRRRNGVTWVKAEKPRFIPGPCYVSRRRTHQYRTLLQRFEQSGKHRHSLTWRWQAIDILEAWGREGCHSPIPPPQTGSSDKQWNTAILLSVTEGRMQTNIPSAHEK